jgi:carbamoyltransferase
MYAILDEFEQLTGRAVVLNTSFNLHGYPLVNDSEDALFVFKNSGLEFMQLGDYLVKKNVNNPEF